MKLFMLLTSIALGFILYSPSHADEWVEKGRVKSCDADSMRVYILRDIFGVLRGTFILADVKYKLIKDVTVIGDLLGEYSDVRLGGRVIVVKMGMQDLNKNWYYLNNFPHEIKTGNSVIDNEPYKVVLTYPRVVNGRSDISGFVCLSEFPTASHVPAWHMDIVNPATKLLEGMIVKRTLEEVFPVAIPLLSQ